MNVSAIIVTRGDVDMQPILDLLPAEWEQIVWDNSGAVSIYDPTHPGCLAHDSTRDLSVYGRYAAIEYASHDLVYVQDDDVIVSDPKAIVRMWEACQSEIPIRDDDGSVFNGRDCVVCNMPQEFRHDFYREHSLVGFGAAFHRDAPGRAFQRYKGFWQACRTDENMEVEVMWEGGTGFDRTCDIVFTALTPRVLVDVPKTNLPYAEDADRMYRQPLHSSERAEMLRLALQVRDV